MFKLVSQSLAPTPPLLKISKNRTQLSRKLSQIQKFVSFLEFQLVYNNVCLKFLQAKLRTLEIQNFRKRWKLQISDNQKKYQ